ncbi:hypothetical protein CDD82_2770 [Ophiocordyceps australis]|uniref:RING-type domain-containing protein n=1 Tax=Ophiocordyceps australis TaxID=1399860 RepID=A0A2C5YLE6_9HYPO|nr:hypothetical protein CDD82_2770 [Ophiocordyceps australis]
MASESEYTVVGSGSRRKVHPFSTTCCVCLYRFTSQSQRDVWIFACGHVACETCFEATPKTSSVCRVCKEEGELWPVEVPVVRCVPGAFRSLSSDSAVTGPLLVVSFFFWSSSSSWFVISLNICSAIPRGDHRPSYTRQELAEVKGYFVQEDRTLGLECAPCVAGSWMKQLTQAVRSLGWTSAFACLGEELDAITSEHPSSLALPLDNFPMLTASPLTELEIEAVAPCLLEFLTPEGIWAPEMRFRRVVFRDYMAGTTMKPQEPQPNLHVWPSQDGLQVDVEESFGVWEAEAAYSLQVDENAAGRRIPESMKMGFLQQLQWFNQLYQQLPFEQEEPHMEEGGLGDWPHAYRDDPDSPAGYYEPG